MNLVPAEFENDLQMDAVKLSGIDALDSNLLFSHVLPRPWASLHNELYIITVNKPVVLEIELGILGMAHIEKLSSFLTISCSQGAGFDHVRTDGYDIWTIPQDVVN